MGRAGALAFGMAALATASVAQTVPDDAAPQAGGLDLPADAQVFGKRDPNVRKPTAIVNDWVITGTDVDQRVNAVIALNQLKLSPTDLDQLRLQILRSLIDETLEIQEAKANKITVDQKEVDQSFAGLARRLQKTPEQLRTWLRQVGSSDRSIRRQIEGELAWNRLLRRNVDINVGDQEIQAMLERIQAAKGTEEYHLYEIYLNASQDRANEVVQAEQKIMEQLRQGTPFDALARTYSEASTKSVGGDLGWVRPAVLPEQLAQAAQGMQIGQVAGPVELPGGFSIIYLADKRQVLTADPRDARLSLKQLTIRFPAGTTEAQATPAVQNFAKATQAMHGCGDAAKTAQALGADVVDNDSIVVRQLPPGPIQDMISNLQVGQATQPFGSLADGVRVLVLCGRDDPQAASLPTVDQIRDQLEEQRTNVRAQRMLRDLRRDALIEYR